MIRVVVNAAACLLLAAAFATFGLWLCAASVHDQGWLGWLEVAAAFLAMAGAVGLGWLAVPKEWL